jgi:hypothetical protein
VVDPGVEIVLDEAHGAAGAADPDTWDSAGLRGVVEPGSRHAQAAGDFCGTKHVVHDF